MKASSQPDASAGAISGRVTVRKVVNGVAPRSIARLLERAVEVGEPRLHDDGDEGQREGDMRGGDGEEAALRSAEQLVAADEQQQHRDAHYHLGHHHRRDHQAGKQGAALKRGTRASA